MKYFDNIMTGQLNQVINNSRPSNALSNDDEPDLQQIRLLNLKQTKLKYKSKCRKISVSNL